MGTSADDVPTLSSLGGVVRTMDTTTDALPPKMVRTCSGFGHGGFSVEDDRYRHVSHQQDRRASGQKNQTIQNTKPDHSVSQEAATASGLQHELEPSKSGSFADQSGGNQGQTRPRSETSANGKAKPEVDRNLEEAVAEQNEISGTNIEIRTKAGTSLQQPQNWIV
jgi:hypothetical protein